MDFALPQKLRSSLDENGTIYLTSYNNQDSEVYRDHIAKSITFSRINLVNYPK